MSDKMRIDVMMLDPAAIKIAEDNDGLFFMIGEHRAYVPPHYFGRKFNEQEILSFFIERIGDIGVGVIVFFLCEMIKNRKIKNVKINNKPVNTEGEIREALGADKND